MRINDRGRTHLRHTARGAGSRLSLRHARSRRRLRLRRKLLRRAQRSTHCPLPTHHEGMRAVQGGGGGAREHRHTRDP
jgi:hypothetical protein